MVSTEKYMRKERTLEEIEDKSSFLEERMK